MAVILLLRIVESFSKRCAGPSHEVAGEVFRPRSSHRLVLLAATRLSATQVPPPQAATHQSGSFPVVRRAETKCVALSQCSPWGWDNSFPLPLGHPRAKGPWQVPRTSEESTDLGPANPDAGDEIGRGP